MINKRKVIAVIPARGGSKRLPRKNVLPLQGKPLIAWSIAGGLDSNYVDQVIVSTDCDEIASVARKYGAEVPFIRPSNIADDTASTDSVLLHLLTKLAVKDSDIIVVLQPTSPLRLAIDIDIALARLIDTNGDGVVSVCECEHSPYWSNCLPNDGSMGSFLKEEVKGKRSQDLPTSYRLNGAVYAFTAKSINNNQGLSYTSSVYSSIMPSERSVDIDNELDFIIADVLLQKITSE